MMPLRHFARGRARPSRRGSSSGIRPFPCSRYRRTRPPKSPRRELRQAEGIIQALATIPAEPDRGRSFSRIRPGSRSKAAAVAFAVPGQDVDHAAESIRAVERALRPPQDLDALDLSSGRWARSNDRDGFIGSLSSTPSSRTRTCSEFAPRTKAEAAEPGPPFWTTVNPATVPRTSRTDGLSGTFEVSVGDDGQGACDFPGRRLEPRRA